MTPTDQSPSDWPANAVPEHWIVNLFDRMLAMYGTRFTELWGGLDHAKVRRMWGVELRELREDQLRFGVATLAKTCLYPPTLPQFLAHCRQAARDAVAASNAPQLTDQRPTDPHEAKANMGRVRDALKPLSGPRVPGVEWAYRILERGTSASGLPLTPEVIRCARDAIRNKGRKAKDDNDDESCTQAA